MKSKFIFLYSNWNYNQTKININVKLGCRNVGSHFNASVNYHVSKTFCKMPPQISKIVEEYRENAYYQKNSNIWNKLLFNLDVVENITLIFNKRIFIICSIGKYFLTYKIFDNEIAHYIMTICM